MLKDADDNDGDNKKEEESKNKSSKKEGFPCINGDHFLKASKREIWFF